MNMTQAIIVYAVCWWLLLFMALPIGVKRQENTPAGMETAAPENPHLRLKCAAVTVLAALVTWTIDIAIQTGIVAVK